MEYVVMEEPEEETIEVRISGKTYVSIPPLMILFEILVVVVVGWLAGLILPGVPLVDNVAGAAITALVARMFNRGVFYRYVSQSDIEALRFLKTNDPQAYIRGLNFFKPRHQRLVQEQTRDIEIIDL